jgi:transposase
MRTLKLTKPDFTGQDIFIGIDQSNTSWKTSIMTQELEHTTFSQPPQVKVLIDYVHRNFPGANVHCVYEAGYNGFWAYEQLRSAGFDCLVVNPADVPTKNREKNFKTDRVDARKLARALRNGELDPIYVPSRTSQEDRSLVRTRMRLVTKQTRCKNQIKGFLGYYGIVIPEELTQNHWSRRFITWIEHLELTQASGSNALRTLLEELLFLRQTLARLTTDIRTLAQQDVYRTAVECLVSIPGISTLTAMILLTELVDIHRFEDLDHLASYCGLVPGEHSSGDTEIITGISSRRNVFLRTVLIEASWIAARKDPALLASFTTFAQRMPKNKAIVKIARKLLNRIRFVLLHQQQYQRSITSTRTLN